MPATTKKRMAKKTTKSGNQKIKNVKGSQIIQLKLAQPSSGGGVIYPPVAAGGGGSSSSASGGGGGSGPSWVRDTGYTPFGPGSQGGPQGPNIKKLLEDAVSDIRDSLRNANTLSAGIVNDEFKQLRDEVNGVIRDLRTDFAASNHAASDLLRQLQQAQAQISQGTNNILASVTSLEQGQAAARNVVNQVGQAVEAVQATQENLRDQVLQAVTRLEGGLGGNDQQLASALNVIEQQLTTRDQLILRQNSELDNALKTILQSTSVNAQGVAQVVFDGVNALAEWNNRTTEGLARLSMRQYEDLSNQNAGLRGGAAVAAQAFSDIQQGLAQQRDDMVTLAQGGSEILRQIRTIPQATIDLLRPIRVHDVGQAGAGMPQIQQPNVFAPPQDAQLGLLQLYGGNDASGQVVPYGGSALVPTDPQEGQMVPMDEQVAGQVIPYSGNGPMVPMDPQGGAMQVYDGAGQIVP